MSRPRIDPEWLSAYLDGELSAEERAQVERELAESGEARRQLAELAALDEMARGLPAEAPAGYFDAFPARVRARLGGAARPRPLVPRWGWAVAAALLIAVALPLLRLDGTARESPPAYDAARQEEPLASREAVAPPAAAPATPLPAAPAPGRFAGEPEPASEPRAAPTAAPAPTPPADPLAKGGADEGLRADALESLALPAPTVSPAAGEDADAAAQERAAAPPPTPEERRLPRPQRARETAPAAPAPKTVGLASAPTADAEAAAAGFADAPETAARFAELDALAPPATAEGARELRDAWRAFAAAHPERPEADEARVRVVELGRRAFLLGGAVADLETARADGEAYLARPDAAQRPRVERILSDLER